MDIDHLNLLCNVNELSSLLAGSANLDTFLQRIVSMVAQHIRAEVCSIYLFDEKNDELYMKVTQGLNLEAVRNVRLKLGEGLVGTCLRDRKPICERKASESPNFKHFDELEEDRFEAFLAVPIQRGLERIGVLVLQRREEDNFDEHDILALQATASQLASSIENARILLALRGVEEDSSRLHRDHEMRLVRGQVASGGFAHSHAVRIERASDEWLTLPDSPHEPCSLEEFRAAVLNTESQLNELEAKLEVQLPEMVSMIFGAHVMMLKDPEFTGAMERLIADGHCAAEAVRSIAIKYVDIFQHSPNAYIREKASDVKDLARRLIGNMLQKSVDACDACEHSIIIARDLYPSDLLKLSNDSVGGIILANGGVTSHIAILARSMKIPMIISPDEDLMEIDHGTSVLMDAEIGNVYIHPTQEVVDEFTERNQRRLETQKADVKDVTLTRCGQPVHLMANINLLSDLTQAKELKVEGVGLYRTEFPFLIRTDFPSESDQIGIYHHILDTMDGQEVTFRTLDVGGDKSLSYFHDTHVEENPVLGMRSIRFSMEFPDIFKEQIRAILCAADGHPQTRIMFPMISSVEEFLQARALVDECLVEMRNSNVPHLKTPTIGMMVEVPSVIEIIEDLAKLADFFCIGTNDFTQFMLAVDRNNEKVQSYFTPGHPSILRSFARVARAAIENNISVSVCGEMAHDERFVPFLIGIGISALSVDSQYLPKLQAFINNISLEECRSITTRLLAESSIKGVQRILTDISK